MSDPRERALTVEQLNTYIKDYLNTSPLLQKVYVKGEISNVRVYGGSGHIYFTLKDENSAIPATMFGGASKLKFKPENGMKVLCLGRVAVFVRDGQYRLYAEEMEPDGIGSLYIAFEQLKKKLEAQGLFSPAHKKKIPKIPFSVGIITAPGGAAVRDMINVSHRRFPAAKLYLYPSLVQGPNAPAQLISALKNLDESGICDVIIIGRGGGSAEDLWCFNDENLARAVYDCKTPIISAVGHETDFTICDFVADLRAPTPSAAAELAVPDVRELKKQFGNVAECRGVVNRKTGDMGVYMVKTVVSEVEDPMFEISLADAQKLSTQYAVGDECEVNVMPQTFGRIAAQTAKQVVVQRIREAERQNVCNEFSEKKGKLVSGHVQRIDYQKGNVMIRVGNLKLDGVETEKMVVIGDGVGDTELSFANSKIDSELVVRAGKRIALDGRYQHVKIIRPNVRVEGDIRRKEDSYEAEKVHKVYICKNSTFSTMANLGTPDQSTEKVEAEQ